MKVGIVGAGAYGQALAHVLSNNDNSITVWSRNKLLCEKVNLTRESNRFPDYQIPEGICFTSNLKELINNNDLIIMAIPTQSLREVSGEMSQYLDYSKHIVLTSKGIEMGTGLFSSEIFIQNYNTPNLAVLSGPSFAVDLINDSITSLSLATKNDETSLLVNANIKEPVFLFNTDDLIGVQVFGAVKNIMAIASGMLNGMNKSDTAKSSFFTCALDTTSVIAKSLGGKEETKDSPAGIGDFHLTLSSVNSRNFVYGNFFGSDDIEGAKKYALANTVEGIYTLKAIKELIITNELDVPLLDGIYNILNGKYPPDTLEEVLCAQNRQLIRNRNTVRK